MSATVASPPGVVRRALQGIGARFGLAIAVVFLTLTVSAPLLAPFDPVRAGPVELRCRRRPRCIGSAPISTAATR